MSRASDPDGTVVRHELLRGGVVVASSTTANPTVVIIDSSVVSGQTYTYTARAVDNTGATGPLSAPLGVTIPPPDVTPPTLPTNFRITSNTTSGIILEWDKSTDDQSGQVDIWYILSSPSDGSYFYTWTRTTPYSTGWFDVPGTTHEIYIQAVDHAGNETAMVGPITFTAQ